MTNVRVRGESNFQFGMFHPVEVTIPQTQSISKTTSITLFNQLNCCNMSYTEAELMFIVGTPTLSGLASFLGSVTLIITILRSELKLTVPVRRIFFGVCIYNCFQSAAHAFSTFPIPKGQGLWGAIGNIGSCDAQG